MNKLAGTIRSIDSDKIVSIVDIEVGKHTFSAQVLDSATYLIGAKVELLFKESEVVISKSLNIEISSINRFLATTTKINSDKIMSEITLAFDGKEIISIITTRSTRRLDLKVGDQVLFLIKANEISLRIDGE